MGFKQAVRTCFRKYFTFSGRASRPEYWYFALFIFLGSLIAGFLDGLIFGAATVETGPGQFRVESEGPFAALFSLATLIPSLSAGWRRMHDSGRSGLFLIYPLIVMTGISIFIGLMVGFETILGGGLLAVIQAAGNIVVLLAVIIFAISPLLVLWWLTRPSQPGTNEYGPNPSEVSP